MNVGTDMSIWRHTNNLDKLIMLIMQIMQTSHTVVNS